MMNSAVLNTVFLHDSLPALGRKAYINDLSGHGAEMNGGRWNGRGSPALYTSGSRALAVLEIAVHVPFGIIPTNFYMVIIEVPEGSGIDKIETADLPGDWNRNPFLARL